MANTLQAKKRIRQNAKRRLANNSKRSAMRTLLKQVKIAIENKDKELAIIKLKLVSSTLDKLVNKKLIHKNKASRHKSRLCLLIKKVFASS